MLSSLILAAAIHGVPAAAQPVEIFGAGTISKSGENVYRGQFSSDGSEFWFFRKVSEDAEDYRIHRSLRQPDGSWSEPGRVHLGGDHSDLYPAPSPDGRQLVFTSYRPFPGDTSSSPNANLWIAERRGDRFGDPVPMRGASMPGHYDAGPWFDGLGALHFESTSPDWTTTSRRRIPPGADLRTATFETDTSASRWERWRDDVRVWHMTPAPDRTFVILEVAALDARGRPGPSDLWLSRRTAAGWTEPVALPQEINSQDETENFVVFTPDGRELLFVRGFTTYYAVPVAPLLDAVR